MEIFPAPPLRSIAIGAAEEEPRQFVEASEAPPNGLCIAVSEVALLALRLNFATI
jgi:hypothetical protein